MFRKEIITTADDYREIVRFTEFKRKKSPIIISIVMAVIAAISLVLAVLNIIPFLIAGIISVVCVIVILSFPIRVSITVKNGIKRGKVLLNAKRLVEIDGAYIKITGGRTDTNVCTPWHTVFSVYETAECFIIYITHETAFCMQKRQLTANETLDLRNYFIKKMGDRFHITFKR